MTLARAVDEIKGFFAFIMLLALVGAAVWLGIARIRKLWFNRRRSRRRKNLISLCSRRSCKKNTAA